MNHRRQSHECDDADSATASGSGGRARLVDLIAARRDNRVAYSIKEVAQMLGVSERTILRRSGSLPVVRDGARTLVCKPQSAA